MPGGRSLSKSLSPTSPTNSRNFRLTTLPCNLAVLPVSHCRGATSSIILSALRTADEGQELRQDSDKPGPVVVDGQVCPWSFRLEAGRSIGRNAKSTPRPSITALRKGSFDHSVGRDDNMTSHSTRGKRVTIRDRHRHARRNERGSAVQSIWRHRLLRVISRLRVQKQVPSFECRDVYQDCIHFTCNSARGNTCRYASVSPSSTSGAAIRALLGFRA